MTEDQLELEALGWLAEIGYSSLYGPNLAPDGDSPERGSYLQVVLVERSRSAITSISRYWRGIRLAWIFFWLKDKSLADLDNLPEPDDIAAEIIENVEAGLTCFRGIAEVLG